MVADSEKTGGGEAAAAVAVVEASNRHQSRRRRRGFNKPSWLLCTIADLDEKMKVLTRKLPKENTSDSFTARANSYYQERPQLLALLHELYNGYLSLADRYCYVLTKNSIRSPLPVAYSKFEETDGEDTGEVVDSDAESSLSFQPPMSVPQVEAKETDVDMIIAALVMKMVECDIVMNELAGVEKRWSESFRKVELQRNLLDVLESERLILLNDNATLGYRVSALVEENKGLASESLFLKRKAAELARCVLKTTEDQQVFMLSKKLEDLQGQVHWLEKRNKEYYDQLMKQEMRNKCKGTKSFKGREVVNQEARGGLSKCFSFDMKRVDHQNVDGGGGVDAGRPSKLWSKFKKFNLFLRGAHFGSAGSCEKGKQNTIQSNLKMKQ